MKSKPRLNEAANFSYSGRLDPVGRSASLKHTHLRLRKSGVAIVVENEYDITAVAQINDYINAEIIAVGLNSDVKWQTGPDPVYRNLTFNGSNGIRNAVVQPNMYNYYFSLTVPAAGVPDVNGYEFSAITGLNPVGTSSFRNKTLFLDGETFTLLPTPYIISRPDVGIAMAIHLNTGDLQQIVGSIISFQFDIDMWLRLYR